MSIFASTEDAAEVRAIYLQALEAMLYSEPPGTVDVLEKLALSAMPPVIHPAVPVDCARMFVSVLEERGDPLAAGALAVYARVASGPVAEAAYGALARLEVDGVTSAFADQIGTLRVAECMRAELIQDAVSYSLVLERPASGEQQVAVVTIGPESCGEHVVGWMGVQAVARQGFPVDPIGRYERRGFESQPADPAELQEALRRALGHMVEHDHPIFELQIGELALLDVALTGKAGTLPRPLLLPPDSAESQEWLAMGAMCQAMEDDGVDLSDDEAREAWLAAQRLEVESSMRRAARRRRARLRRGRRR
jgi:hypothetical protein